MWEPHGCSAIRILPAAQRKGRDNVNRREVEINLHILLQVLVWLVVQNDREKLEGIVKVGKNNSDFSDRTEQGKHLL